MVFFYKLSDLELLKTGLAQIAKTLNQLLLDEKVWRRSKHKSHILQIILLGIRTTFSKLILFANLHRVAAEAIKQEELTIETNKASTNQANQTIQSDSASVLAGPTSGFLFDQDSPPECFFQQNGSSSTLVSPIMSQSHTEETIEQSRCKYGLKLVSTQNSDTSTALNSKRVARTQKETVPPPHFFSKIPESNEKNPSCSRQKISQMVLIKHKKDHLDFFDKFLITEFGLLDCCRIRHKRKDILLSFFKFKLDGWKQRKQKKLKNSTEIIECEICNQRVVLLDKEKHWELCKRHLKQEKSLFLINIQLRNAFFIIFKAKMRLMRLLRLLK